MGDQANISSAMSFMAGFLLFFSPCIFPLIPSYISYLTGISFKDLELAKEKTEIKKITVIHAIFFVIGFSLVFVLLGLTATVLGKTLMLYQPVIKKIGAILIILFGLAITGIVKVPFLQSEKKIHFTKKKITFFGSLVVGAVFGFAWTPCVGPVLGSILIYASTQTSLTKGFILLCSFSVGLAIPFVLSAFLINSFLAYFKKIKFVLKWVNIIAGIILIAFGILLLKGGAI